LSETGLVGGLLFFGFLVVALLALWRQARRSSAPGLALACLAGSGYWLLHSSIDWFWEFPAVTGPGLALLALGGAPAAIARPELGRRTRERLSALARVGGAAAAALAAATVLAVPWVAVRLTDQALALGPTHQAYDLLHTAARLNPFSEQPALAEAVIAGASRDRGFRTERRALHAALERDPFDWYPHLMLGIIAGQEHRPTVARAELAQAHRLSPQDLVVVYAQRRLAIGKPLTQRQIDKILLEVTSTLRGVRQ